MFGLSEDFWKQVMQPGVYGLVVFRTHRERAKYCAQYQRAFEAVGAKFNYESGTLTFTWGSSLLLYAVTADDHHSRIRGYEFDAVEFLASVGALEDAFIRSRVRAAQEPFNLVRGNDGH